MRQIYNENTKRPKPKENQLVILGISSREFMHFAGNSAGALGPGESTAVSLRVHPKSCHIFLIKVATSFP